MTVTVYAIASLPRVPAIYAMYGGSDSSRYVAYVGLGGSLRGRIEQHLVKRDSSVSTGTQAVGLNPAHVREVAWWEHACFEDSDALHAAELVAFDIFEPALRSRGAIRHKAHVLYADPTFKREMTGLFTGASTGRLPIPTLSELAARVRELEATVAELELRGRQRK